MHHIGGRQSADLNDAFFQKTLDLQGVNILPHRCGGLHNRQRTVTQDMAEGFFLLRIFAAVGDIPDKNVMFIQETGVLPLFQSAQMVQYFRMSGSGYADGHDPEFFQIQTVIVVMDSAVTAQTKGPDIQTVDKCLPFTNGYAIGDGYRPAIPDKGDIRGGAAHIHHNAVGTVCQMGAAQCAGRRTAEQCLHWPQRGKFLAHQRTVTADDNQRFGVDLTNGKRCLHRIQKFPDHGEQTGIEQCTGAPLQAVQL